MGPVDKGSRRPPHHLARRARLHHGEDPSEPTHTNTGPPSLPRWRRLLIKVKTKQDGEGARLSQLLTIRHEPRASERHTSLDCSAPESALIDPAVEESAGTAYVADRTMSRSNEGALLEYLQTKFGRPQLMTMDSGYSAGFLELRRTANLPTTHLERRGSRKCDTRFSPSKSPRTRRD